MRGEAGLPKYSAVVRKHAGIAQLGERQTEDLKVAGSIPAVGILLAVLFCSGVMGRVAQSWSAAKRSHGILAEWLRRLIRNQLGIARGSSNLSDVDYIFFFSFALCRRTPARPRGPDRSRCSWRNG